MTAIHRCIAGISTALTLVLLTGCGEIELPSKDNPQPPGDTGTENPKPSEGDDENPSGGEDKPGGGEDMPGGGDGQKVEHIGEIGASIVNKQHIVIDGCFYLSRNEINGVYSAYADANAFAHTQTQVAAYREEGLEDWRIPTEEEARLLRFCFGSYTMAYGSEPLPVLNKAITSYNWEMLSNDLRYLCDEGRKSFNLHPNGKITKSGAKTVYTIRLVHELPSE